MVTPTITAESTAGETVLPVIGEYIAIKPGFCGGKPHIAGHRIKVQHVAIWHERMGKTPEEIVATYSTLLLPAVYAALAYYHAHRAEIDADLEGDERFVAEMKAKANPSLLQERLAERPRAELASVGPCSQPAALPESSSSPRGLSAGYDVPS